MLTEGARRVHVILAEGSRSVHVIPAEVARAHLSISGLLADYLRSQRMPCGGVTYA